MKILSKYNQLTETRNMLKKEGLSFAYSNNVSYLLGNVDFFLNPSINKINPKINPFPIKRTILKCCY